MAGQLIYGELVRAQLQGSAADLTPTATGLVYFNTTTGLKWYDGTVWRTAVELTATQALTNKDYNGGTASNTSRVTLSKASTATLAALTRKEANLFYDTTLGAPVYDSGSALVTLATTATSQDSPVDAKNYSVSATVAGNAMTVALKDKAGSDPSGGSPVNIAFRSATATTGTYSVVSATSATSVVISSGSTLGHTSAKQGLIYVYALNNAGAIELAVSTMLFDDGTLQSTTAEGGAGAADTDSVMYSTTARTSKAVRLIARLRSTQTTAGTWGVVPTETSTGTDFQTAPTSQVVAWGGNGVASTNTAIFQLTQSSTIGNGITYASDGTLGTRFTINENGVYAISYQDFASASDIFIGISLNTTQLTTAIDSLSNIAECLAALRVKSTNGSGTAVATARLVAGDVIRPHVGAGVTNHIGGANVSQQFRITQIARF